MCNRRPGTFDGLLELGAARVARPVLRGGGGSDITSLPNQLQNYPHYRGTRPALAAPAIGVALGALHTFQEQTGVRLSVRGDGRMAEDPFIQLCLAEATAPVAAAHDRLRHNCATLMHLLRAGDAIPLTQRARCRWDAAQAVAWCVQAVDHLFAASGGRAIFDDHPLQRAFRDIQAIRAHAGNNTAKAAAVFGRAEFSLPPVDLRF